MVQILLSVVPSDVVYHKGLYGVQSRSTGKTGNETTLALSLAIAVHQPETLLHRQVPWVF